MPAGAELILPAPALESSVLLVQARDCKMFIIHESIEGLVIATLPWLEHVLVFSRKLI